MKPADAIAAQGVVYAGIALATGFAAASLPTLPTTAQILVVAVLVLVFGVPHGAYDTLWAKRLLGLDGPGRWALFGLAYGTAAACVVLVWAWAPGVFLAGFLAASVLHFSGDPEGIAAPWTRLASGLAPIALPTLLHEPEVAHLFGLLVGAAPGAAVASGLAGLAWPTMLLVVGAIVWEGHRRRGRTAFELAGTATLVLLAPPLVAFAVYFCLMHAARHVLRTARAAEIASPVALAAAAFLPMAGTLVLAGAGWFLLREEALDARVMQLLFVGLAALTAPHMILVEPVRLRGWVLARTGRRSEA